MKQLLLVCALVACLPAPAAHGAQIPVEVIFALDVSLSMKRNTGSGGKSLHCPGNQPEVDICGDGICSGHERTGTCAADCISCTVTGPGSCPVCPSATADASRYAMVKRAMRNLIPSLRTEAKFSLVVFPRQKNYYPYYPADTSSVSSKPVSLYLSKAELFSGGWVDGAGWDVVNDRPVDSFTRHGTLYTLLSQVNDPAITTAADSLYRRQVGNLFEEKRFPYGGGTLIDGGEEWTYSGSYYTYAQRSRLGQNGTNRYTAPEFRGPQYEEGGVTWIYHRFEINDDGPIAEVTPYTSELLVPLTADLQADRDQALGQLMNYFNRPAHGGLVTAFSTPTRSALEVAGQHFADRALTDPWVACRGRFVILLSDGLHYPSTSTHDPVPETLTLFGQDPQNPIHTLAVGVPGLPSGGNTELDQVADYGDDGLLNSSTSAYIATTEAELISSLEAALAQVTGGDSGSITCLLPCYNGTCPEGQRCVNDQYCQPIPPDAGVALDAGVDGSTLADQGAADLPSDSSADQGAPADLLAADAAAGDGAGDSDAPTGDAQAGDLSSGEGQTGDATGPVDAPWEGGVLDGAPSDLPGGAERAAQTDSSLTTDTQVASEGGAPPDSGAGHGTDRALAGAGSPDGGCDCAVHDGDSGPLPLWLGLSLLLLFCRRRPRS